MREFDTLDQIVDWLLASGLGPHSRAHLCVRYGGQHVKLELTSSGVFGWLRFYSPPRGKYRFCIMSPTHVYNPWVDEAEVRR